MPRKHTGPSDYVEEHITNPPAVEALAPRTPSAATQHRRLVADAEAALRSILRDAILNGPDGMWVLLTEVLLHPQRRCDDVVGTEEAPGCCYKKTQFHEALHREWCHWAMDKTQKRKGILAPRGSFKSTVISFAKCVFAILRNPNIRILIVSQKQKNAIGFCGQAKKAFQDNERMRWLFAEWCVAPGKQFGNEQEFTVPNRTDISLVAPTVYSVHLGAAMASQHYDIIIADDPISEDDVATEDMAAKSRGNFNRIVPLLDPGGEILIVGTRYAYNDLYSGLILVEQGGTATVTPYTWIVRSALELPNGKAPATLFDPDAKPIFPTRFPLEVLLRLYEECCLDAAKGEIYFWNQYMNQSRTPGQEPFLAEWFVEITPESVPPLFGTVITMDTALKDDAKRTGGDFTVAGPGGWDAQGRLYLLPDGIRSNKMRSKEFCDIIVTWARKHNTPLVAKQKVSEDTLGTTIGSAFEAAHLPFAYKPLTIAGMGRKAIRIKDALQAPMQKREIFWVQRRRTDGTLESHPLLEHTKKELVNLEQFPTDDAADWLANFYHPDVRARRLNIAAAGEWKVPGAPQQQSPSAFSPAGAGWDAQRNLTARWSR